MPAVETEPMFRTTVGTDRRVSISGGGVNVHLTNAGLPDDARNIYGHVLLFARRYERLVEKSDPRAAEAFDELNAPILTYDEFTETYLPGARKRLASVAQQESIAVFNEQVGAYNRLAAKKKLTPQIVGRFVDKFQRILEKGTLERSGKEQ